MVCTQWRNIATGAPAQPEGAVTRGRQIGDHITKNGAPTSFRKFPQSYKYLGAPFLSAPGAPTQRYATVCTV